MSDILKFACSAPNCGRKFSTQEALNTHFNLRHPELKKNIDNKTSMEKIINKISKPKLNPQEKHHFLQPITKRKSMSKIINTNNKEIKDEKNKKENLEEDIDIQNIPSFQEEKEKRLLNNLFGQINNLENYLEKDCEFHKEFNVPDVPDYDTMYDSDNEKKEKDRNEKEIKNSKKEKDKIYEITEEMIFKNNDNNEIIDYDKYKNIHELDLSKKNIKTFKNKKNISFEKLSELYVLNLSENIISEANDIKYFESLKELYINNNKIIDISFCEFLPNLIILNIENNNIESITSLSICTKLTILKLGNNNIKYLNSTLRIFKNLKNLEETTINQNPFLSELVSYREYFISNYKNIKKFDGEIITEEKRKSAELFYKENNPLYKNITQRPMSSKPDVSDLNKNNKDNNNVYDIFEENSEDNSNNENQDEIISMSKTQNVFSNRNKQILNNNEINVNNKDNANKSEIKKEEEKLNKIIEEQNIMIEKLKNELENASILNKQYEIQIDQYNNELVNYQNNNNNLKNNQNEDEETIKIKKELEMWKKQYFDLLEKNIENEDKLKFSQDLFNDKKIKKENNKNKKDIIERPQTAQVRSNLTRDFHKLYEEINILQGSKNIFNDVLNEESDEEEEEEKEKEELNEEEKEEKEENNENEIKEEIKDEIPDDEIEEMFRKSYQDIQKMRKDLQEINNNMDKNNENKKNNIEDILNEDRKGNKPSLKPIIYKKESNKNPTINKNQNFGRHGNIISGNNKNINEDNKNAMAQRYNALLYKLKK